jgi:methylphosphotriester-DNA--protein-cysteine methyltransferase
MPFPREKILPVPHFDLKINLGDPHLIASSNASDSPKRLAQSWLTGIFGQYHIVEWPSNTHLYGVRFKPGGAFPFMGFPMSEIHNKVVSVVSFWGKVIAELSEELYHASNIREGFDLLEGRLVERLGEEFGSQKLVEHALDRLAQSRGALPIQQLSRALGMSQSHLSRQFKLVVGTSTKEMARLYRFENVLRCVNPSPPMSWAKVAHQLSYYDQSHLNKEFFAFTGLNPSAYIQARQPVYARDAVVDQQSLRTLPTD